MYCSLPGQRLVGLVVKASTSRAESPGFESCLCRDFFGVESYQWLKNWHSSGYPARRLALYGQHWDWSARCQYTVTGWGRTLDLQLLSQVWQHVKLSEQIRPWDTLACCWDVKQATNKQSSWSAIVVVYFKWHPSPHPLPSPTSCIL